MVNTIRRMKDKRYETYNIIVDYVDDYVYEAGDVTAVYECIKIRKKQKIKCVGMAYYLPHLEEKFDILVYEGETLIPNF